MLNGEPAEWKKKADAVTADDPIKAHYRYGRLADVLARTERDRRRRRGIGSWRPTRR